MKPILAPAACRLIEKFANSKTAIVFDYDGTLSPIVQRARKAYMRPKTTRLLKEAALLYPIAVLSGRKLSDMSARVRGLGIREVVGNHGLEWRGSKRSHQFKKRVAGWKKEIIRAVRSGALKGLGIELEDKVVSISIHYRMARNHSKARREIKKLLSGFSDKQIIEGKGVFNLLPDARVNKGTAVLELKKKLRCDRVIFAGDDKTDEFVFALRPRSFLLDVHVGRGQASRARYFLPTQRAIDRFLEVLIALRSGT
jgi:trehalose 6-phosphate phosphatase